MKWTWVWMVVAACAAFACSNDEPKDSRPVIDSVPLAVSNSPQATFTFHAVGASRFECQLDTEPGVPCTSPYTITVGEGTHTLTITAFDGNTALPDPIVVVWTVDLTPPDTTISSGPAPVDNALTVTFAFAGVPSADVARFECALDAASFAPCTSPATVTTTAGQHTYSVRAIDLADNADPTPSEWMWTVDATPPDTSITSGPALFDNSLTATFTFAGVPPADAARFECALDASTFAPCTSPATMTTTPGAHTFEVRAIDAAENVDATPAHWMWTIDTSTIDTTIVTGPAVASSTQGAVAFTFTSTDASAAFECRIDAQSYSPCTSPAQFSALTEGSHTFSVRARNGSNVDPTPASRTWNVDLTPPPIVITQSPAAYSNASTPVFAFSSTDPGATFACQIDGAVSFTPCTSPWTGPTVADGSRTFRVRATDAAGNTSQASYVWISDRTQPVITISYRPGNPTPIELARFEFTSSEGGSLECQIDGIVPFEPCTSPWTRLTPGGQNVARFRATDRAGNVGNTTYTWVVTPPGPKVEITGKPNARDNETEVTFTFHAVGSIAVIDCSLDNAPYTPCTSPAVYSGLAEGAHTFSVRVRDAANNANIKSHAFTIDITPPILTMLTWPSGTIKERFPVLDWTYSGGISSCWVDGVAPCKNLSRGAKPPKPLADGPHTIRITVTDDATNQVVFIASFVVDAVGPTVSLDSTPSNLSNASVATFTFSSPDAVGFDCQIDDVAFTACTSPFVALVPDGVHTFRVRGNDALGNHTVKVFTWATDANPEVTTTLAVHDNGSTISVSWRNLPGNLLDWISFAPQGSSDTTVIQRVYTNGAANGTHVFAGGAPNGDYVARAYVNDTFTKVTESSVFHVSAPCPQLSWSAPVNVLNPGDVASLAPYTHLDSLTFSPTSDFTVHLPCLQQVGQLAVNDGDGTHHLLGLFLPRLRIAQGIYLKNGPPVVELPSLERIGGMRIEQPAPLPDLSSMSRLVTWTGGLRIETTANGTIGPNAFKGVTSLTNQQFNISLLNGHFDGFNNVTSITGDFTIMNTGGDFAGLNRLSSAPATFRMLGNNQTITGLKSLATVAVDVFLEISGPSTATLPSLETVGGVLDITAAPPLDTLRLPSLRSAYRLVLRGSALTPSTLRVFDAPLLQTVFFQLAVQALPMFCGATNLLEQLFPAPLFFDDNNSQPGPLICN